MDEVELKKPHWLRRFWWVGLVVIVILVSGIALANYFHKQTSAINTPIKKPENVSSVSKVICPNSITFENEIALPIADYAGNKKRIENSEVTDIRNQCPSVEIKSFTKNSTVEKQNNQPTSATTKSPDQTQSPSDSTPSTPSNQTPTSSIKIDTGTVITPYFDESDVSSVNEAYSLNPNNPYWGFSHSGIDFMATKDIRVQAVIDGTVSSVDTAKADGQMGWHTSLCINRGSEGVCYNLETFSSDQAIGDSQKAGMKVKEGDVVKKGDELGTLIHGGDGSHIDFGIITGGNRVCPEPYFTTSAKDSVLQLIHKDHPSWEMCAE